jgi:hypothetical protein
MAHSASNQPSDATPPSGHEQFEQIRNRAHALFRDHRYEEAADLYRRLTVEPGYEAHAYYGLGMVAVAVRDLEAAEERLRYAVALDPRQHSAMAALGKIALARGDTEKSRMWFEAAKERGNSRVAADLEQLDRLERQTTQNDPMPQRQASATPVAHHQARQPTSVSVKRSGSSHLKGKVSHFVPRQEHRGRRSPPVIVWMFRVNTETPDHQIEQSQVEMRALHFKSTIGNGDDVDLRGRWNTSGVFVAHWAYNVTSHSKVLGQPSHGVMVAMLIIVFLILAIVVLTVG